MNTPLKTLCLALLLASSCIGAHAASPRPAAPHTAINPQPLPPRHDPPTLHTQINPQPLPPQDHSARSGVASVRPYIGETEKNLR